MDATKLSFLTAVLGAEGAQALNKAVQRYEPLENVLLPRVILSWLSIAARTGYEGEIPGVAETYLAFEKNESDLYDGTLSINSIPHPFENASFMHVVAGVAVALKADYEGEVGVKDSDLVNLGRQVDLLAKAEFVNQFEPLQKGAMQRLAPFNPKTDRLHESDEANVAMWQGSDREPEHRIAADMPANARMRALHRLGSSTNIRRNPATGEREFLLHRGVSEEEYAYATHPNNITHPDVLHGTAPAEHFVNHDDVSSWTPRHGLARKFAREYGNDRVLSAWVPESAIGSVPKQMGQLDARADLNMDDEGYSPPVGANEYGGEHEILVHGGHNSLRASPEEVAPQISTSANPIGLRSPMFERHKKLLKPGAANQLPDTSYGYKKSEREPKKKGKIFNFKKSQLENECPDCGIPQVEDGHLTGCMCVSDLVGFAKLSKSTNGYSIEFGPEWGEDELSLIFDITGAANG